MDKEYPTAGVYTIIDERGEIAQILTVSDIKMLDDLLDAGQQFVPGEPPGDAYWNFDSDGWMPKPARPSMLHSWDRVAKEWRDIRPLAELKRVKNEQINAWRLAANRGTFMFADHPIACDELSRSDIEGVNGYVGFADALPPGFPGFWKADDNFWVPIPDIATWKALYMAMVAAGTANFQRAQYLKMQLESASSPTDIDRIVW